MRFRYFFLHMRDVVLLICMNSYLVELVASTFTQAFIYTHLLCIRPVNALKILRRPWPAAYINFMQNTHQIHVLTKPLSRAQAIFYSLPNNEWGTKYRWLTYSAK